MNTLAMVLVWIGSLLDARLYSPRITRWCEGLHDEEVGIKFIKDNAPYWN